MIHIKLINHLITVCHIRLIKLDEHRGSGIILTLKINEMYLSYVSFLCLLIIKAK